MTTSSTSEEGDLPVPPLSKKKMAVPDGGDLPVRGSRGVKKSRPSSS